MNVTLNDMLLRIDCLHAERHIRQLSNDEQTELDDLTNEHEGILEQKAEVIMKRDKLCGRGSTTTFNYLKTRSWLVELYKSKHLIF